MDLLGFTFSAGGVHPAGKYRDKFARLGKYFAEHPLKSWEEIQEVLYLILFVRKFIPGRAGLVDIIKNVFFTPT